MKNLIYSALCLTLLFSSCKDDDNGEPATDDNETVNTIPEFFKSTNAVDYGLVQPEIIKLNDVTSRIFKPTDVAFNPTRDGECWILNEGTENTGGSTVTTNVTDATMFFSYRQDGNAWHFMSLPTALAFSLTGDWGTSPGVLDANHSGGTFTGPTLWSGNLEVYARPSGGNGSHLDMLHGSPYSMGIASEKDNVYWVFDGYNSQLVRYDFAQDHGPGNADHDDGKIQRVYNISLTRNGTIPSHLEVDEDQNYLYVVDGGRKRVLKVDLNTFKKVGDLNLVNEQLAEHAEYSADHEVLLKDRLTEYCGLALNGDRLFLSDFESGEIICLDVNTGKELGNIFTNVEGITGIEVFKNELYFVSYNTNGLYKVIPQ